MPAVRRGILFTVVVLVVAVLLSTQVSELFDTWDKTLETGNDIEFSLTIVALCVGACVWFASLLWRCFPSLVSKIHSAFSRPPLLSSPCAREERCGLLSPSPPPLRI
jgi:hypothetical protein